MILVFIYIRLALLVNIIFKKIYLLIIVCNQEVIINFKIFPGITNWKHGVNVFFRSILR